MIGEGGLKKSDIGVVTPYSAQARLISDMLRQKYENVERGSGGDDLPGPDGDQDDQEEPRGERKGPRKEAELGVEVSSVDGYQGREKEVILFSAVRSNSNGKIGFVADRRRLNVALTRARRGLVVFGDARTLERGCPNWRAYWQWCRENGVQMYESELE